MASAVALHYSNIARETHISRYQPWNVVLREGPERFLSNVETTASINNEARGWCPGKASALIGGTIAGLWEC